MKKLIFFIAPAIILSCNNSGTNTTSTKDSTSTNIVTSNSVTTTSSDFVSQTNNDNFFIKKQFGKTITISNLICFMYVVQGSEVTISCASYNPQTNAMIMGDGMWENRTYQLNGQNINSTQLGMNRVNFHFKLSNADDVKAISFYLGSKPIGSVFQDFKDYITVTGTLNDYGGYAYEFTNCKFVKQDIPKIDAALIPKENVTPSIIVDKAYCYNNPDENSIDSNRFLSNGEQVQMLYVDKDFGKFVYVKCNSGDYYIHKTDIKY